MKTVKNIDIETIIRLATALYPDGPTEIDDVVGYEYTLKGRDELSPYRYFSRYFGKKRSKFKYHMIDDYDEGYYFNSQFGSYTNREGEWETFWAAFFNSAEDLNDCFWRDYKGWEDGYARDFKEVETETVKEGPGQRILEL